MTPVAFNSDLELFFASGDEVGFFCEIAQQVLLVQQPGLQDFCAGASDTMQERAFTCTGAASNAPAATIEIAIRINFDNFNSI